MSATPEVPEAPEAEAELLPVEKRVAELREEVMVELAKVEPQYQRLRALADKLDGKVVFTPTPTSTPTRTRRASSNGGKNRMDEFLSVVQAEPGLQIPAIAERMGIKPNYLYRLRPRAEVEGKIRVQGQNIFPAEMPVAA